MAFLGGTGSRPPFWYLQLRMSNMWGIRPWEWPELSKDPRVFKWVMRQLAAWRLEAEAHKDKYG
jgi:hypothetical protein